MALIRQEEVYPVAGTPWAQAVQMVAGTGDVSRYDIVLVNDIASAGSVIPKAVKADADGTNLHAGIMMIATGAAAAGETFLAVPSIVITNVNSAAPAGSPVYLSDTAGAFTVTEPTGLKIPIIVGTVLVNSATVGAVMLKPGGVTTAGLKKVGKVTFATGDTSKTAALGANFGNGTAFATLAANATNNISVRSAAVAANGTLTVNLSGAPGSGGVDVNYVVYSDLIDAD
jgi:hypothetical protein